MPAMMPAGPLEWGSRVAIIASHHGSKRAGVECGTDADIGVPTGIIAGSRPVSG